MRSPTAHESAGKITEQTLGVIRKSLDAGLSDKDHGSRVRGVVGNLNHHTRARWVIGGALGPWEMCGDDSITKEDGVS